MVEMLRSIPKCAWQWSSYIYNMQEPRAKEEKKVSVRGPDASSSDSLFSFMSSSRACSDKNAAMPAWPPPAAMSAGVAGHWLSLPWDSGAGCAPRTSSSTTVDSHA